MVCRQHRVSTYRTHLEPPLPTDHREWEVGLAMVTVPERWNNVDHRYNTVGLIAHPWNPSTEEPPKQVCLLRNDLNPTFCFKGEGHAPNGSIEMETHVPNGDYRNVQQLLDALNTQIDGLWKTFPVRQHLANRPVRADPNNKDLTEGERLEEEAYQGRERMLRGTEEKGSFLSFKSDETKGKVYLQLNHPEVLHYLGVLPRIDLRLCGPIVTMLGWSGTDLTLSLQAALTDARMQNGVPFYADQSPNLQIQFDLFYLYTNIVESQIVGDVVAPLLDVIPSQRSYHRPARIHYLPLKYSRLPSIGMYIRTSQGTPVPFLDGNVVVKLHFRRRQRR